MGINSLDEEQLGLASSKKFWTFIEKRRKQQTISRTELEQRIDALSERAKKPIMKIRTKVKRSVA